jgi:hypothetical protein
MMPETRELTVNVQRRKKPIFDSNHLILDSGGEQAPVEFWSKDGACALQ